MSDLAIAVSIAVPLVLGAILALGYSLHRSEAREVKNLLPKVKCPCGHSSLSWNGGVWGSDGPCDHPDLDPGLSKDEANGPDESVGGSGYVFDCPVCQRTLWFSRDARLHREEMKTG